MVSVKLWGVLPVTFFFLLLLSCNCGWSTNYDWCHDLGFIIRCVLLCGRFRGRFVAVFLARRDDVCPQQSLAVHCCVQLPKSFSFQHRNVLPFSQWLVLHRGLCYTEVGVGFSVFVYRLSADIPRFSRLLIQMLPECLKLFIPAATIFGVCRPPLICYLTPSYQ